MAGDPVSPQRRSSRVKLRVNPHRVMRGAPYFYVAAILALVVWGGVDIVRIVLASNAVIAQTGPAVSTSNPSAEPGSQPSSEPNQDSSPSGNRSYIVRRTSQGSPVQVNVSEPAPASGAIRRKLPLWTTSRTSWTFSNAFSR